MFYSLSKVKAVQRSLLELKGEMGTLTSPIQALSGVVTALQTNIGTLSTSITNISTQAEKIKNLTEKYAEAEKLTRTIYSILIGSYSKGRTGETLLKNLMGELMKIGIVRSDVPINGKRVEYCVSFSDGKLLAVDSKVVSTKELERLYDEKTTEEERNSLAEKIKGKLKSKIDEVAQYINPEMTLPCAIMAVPDSLLEYSAELMPEAVRRGVIIVGYSAVPQLITYFVQIHSFYAIEEDVKQLQERISRIQQEISKLDDRFFNGHFERPITILRNGIRQIRNVVKTVNQSLGFPIKEENQEVKVSG